MSVSESALSPRRRLVLADMLPGDRVRDAVLVVLCLAAGLAEGFELGVRPFLAGDALKVLLAAGLLPGVWALVGRTPQGRA